MKKLLFVILLSFLLSCCQVDKKRPIHVHISSGVDSAIVIFDSEDSVKVINYRQKKDSVRSRPLKSRSKMKTVRQHKDSKPQKYDPVPAF